MTRLLRNPPSLVVPAVLLLLAAVTAPGAERAFVIKGATILTMTRGIIEDGTVVIENGKIAAVGKDVIAPDGAEVIEAQGEYVLPGLVDPHSHLGVYSLPALEANADGNEMTGDIEAQVRSEDAINTDDPEIACCVGWRNHGAGSARQRQQHRWLGHHRQAERRPDARRDQVSRCAAQHEVGLGREPQAHLRQQRTGGLDAHG